MDRLEVLKRLDEERRTIAYDGTVLESLPTVTRGKLANGAQHWITFSLLNADTADEEIDRQIEHHRRLNVSFEWKLFAHDSPSDLRQRLERRGMRVGAREALLVYPLAQGGKWIDQTRPVRVARLQRVEQVADYRRVNQQVYRRVDDPMADELELAIKSGSRQHLGYVAYSESGEPVSTGRLYLHPDSWFGGLYGGATAPAFRGRGFYKALVAARARDAAASGARYLSVDALPTSRPILERLGFQWITDTWPCEWSPE
jgi:GNAT superfamily N-acetyltransferase